MMKKLFAQSMLSRRRGFIVYFACFMALANISCRQERPGSNSSDHSVTKSKIRLGIDSAGVVSTLVFVAQEKKLWDAEGIEVEVVGFASGRDAVQALLGGRVDMATVADFPFMLASQRDPSLRVIGTICEFNGEIVGRRDAGIVNVADLKGKKIAVTVGSVGQFFLDTYLSNYNIQATDYKRVNLNPPQMVPAISRGDVDACATWQPHLYRAKSALQGNAVMFNDQATPALTFNIASSDKFLASQPQVADRLLRGLLKAERATKDDEDDAIKIVAKRTGTEPAIIKAIWKEQNFSLSLTNKVVDVLKKEENWARATGTIKSDSPTTDWTSRLDKQPLSNLDRAAVSLR